MRQGALDDVSIERGEVLLGHFFKDQGTLYIVRYIDPSKRFVRAEAAIDEAQVEDDVEDSDVELDTIDYDVCAEEQWNYYQLN